MTEIPQYGEGAPEGQWTQATKEKIRAIQDGLEGLIEFCNQAGLEGEDKRNLLEPYYSMLSELVTEELPVSIMLDHAEYMLKLEGSGVDGREPRAKLLADYLNKGRSGYAKVAREVAKVRDFHFTNLPNPMDFAFAGKGPGSLYIGFNLVDDTVNDDGQVNLEITHHQYVEYAKAALKALGDGIAAVTSGFSLDDFNGLFESDEIRNAVLRALRDLSPSGYEGEYGAVSTIKVMGKGLEIREFRTLTPDTRDVLNQWIDALELPDEHYSLVGYVREIDLDKRRLELRDVEGVGDSVRCSYPSDFEEAAPGWVGQKVNVVGDAHFDESGDIKGMTVSRVEVLEQEP
jgi:hypothetical protein